MAEGRSSLGHLRFAVLVKDVAWINASGEEMQDEQWIDAGMRCFGMLIDGRAQPSGIWKRGGDATMLLPWKSADDRSFYVVPAFKPSQPFGFRWHPERWASARVLPGGG